jgi:hypothetical protein
MAGCRALSQPFVVEAQAYVLHCTSIISARGIDMMKPTGSPFMECDAIPSSAVFGPDGCAITSPETKNEELIFADHDFDAIVKVKSFLMPPATVLHPLRKAKLTWLIKAQWIAVRAMDSRPDLLRLGANPRSKKVVRSE